MPIFYTGTYAQRFDIWNITLIRASFLDYLIKPHRGFLAIFKHFEIMFGYSCCLSFIASHSSASYGLPYCCSLTASIFCPREKNRWRTETICEVWISESSSKPLILCCGFCVFPWQIFTTSFRTPTSRVTVLAPYCKWWWWARCHYNICHYIIQALVYNSDFLGSCFNNKLL